MTSPTRFLATCLLLASPALHAAEVDSWRFRVFLDERPIGTHEFLVSRDGAAEQVHIEARFDVRVFRIPVYSYTHVNHETWRNGCLHALTARTNDNGEESNVNLRNVAGSLVLDTGQPPRAVEGECLRSFAYWRRDITRESHLLNPQTGELVPVRIDPVTPTPPSSALDRQGVDAYRIASRDGTIDIEVGYAASSGRWLYLESTLDNGRVLRYLPDPVANDGDTRSAS